MKWALLILFTTVVSIHGQGTFENLDFENATIAPTPPGGATFPADPTQALPGWTVGGSGTVVAYNTVSLGAPAISLMGPNFPNSAGFTPLQGSYSVYIQYFGISGGPPTLSQTGLVPVGTKSISFLVRPGENIADSTATVLSLNGVGISLVPIAGNRVAGDVTAFGGNVAQLTVSTINARDFIYFDDIQFSPNAVPEPGTFALGALGMGLISWRRWRNSAR